MRRDTSSSAASVLPCCLCIRFTASLLTSMKSKYKHVPLHFKQLRTRYYNEEEHITLLSNMFNRDN